MSTKIEIKNPVWIASSYLTEDIEGIKEAAKNGAGGIVIKTIGNRLSPACDRNCYQCGKGIGTKRGRLIFVDKYRLYSFSLHGKFCEPLSRKEGKLLLGYLKKNHPNVIRIASIGGIDAKENLEIAKEVELADAQIIEINAKAISWHHSEQKPNQFGTYFIEIVKTVRKNVSLPVIAKMVDFLLREDFFKKLSKACDGLTIMNTIRGDLPKKFEDQLTSKIKQKRCVIAGEPLWSYVRKYVPIAKKYFQFVSASGGIYNPERAKEIISLGADTVQLCSGIEFKGPGLIRDILRAL